METLVDIVIVAVSVLVAAATIWLAERTATLIALVENNRVENMIMKIRRKAREMKEKS